MDKSQLLDLISKGEDSYTEFKEESVHSDDIAASIVAFANAEGGYLIIGVTDDGQTVGVKEPDKMMQRIDSIAYQNCAPPVSVFQKKIMADGNVALAVKIATGGERPYRTNRGVYYIRTSSGRRQASREELLRLYQASLDIFPDEALVPKSSMKDLDLTFFEKFFEDYYQHPVEEEDIPIDRLLQNMKVLEEQRATRGGILLFGRKPQEFIPYARISAVRFEGNAIGEKIIDMKDIEGKIPDQIEHIISFLKIHTRISAKIKEFKREEEYEVPLEALREVVVNAVAHRDYTLRSQVRIFIFDDRIEVSSPGKLPNTLTPENMRYGTVPVWRNPLISSALVKMKFMSQIGSGIPRVFRLVKEASRQEPKLIALENEFKVVIPKKVVRSQESVSAYPKPGQ